MDYKLFKLSTYKESSMHVLLSLVTWLISINLKFPDNFPIHKLYFYGFLAYIAMQTFVIFNDYIQSEEAITNHLGKYKLYYFLMSITQGLTLNYLFTLLNFSVTYFILTMVGCIILLLFIMIILPLTPLPCYPGNIYLNTFLTIMIPNIIGLIGINYYVHSNIITNIIYFESMPLFFIANMYLYIYNLNRYMIKIYNEKSSLEVNTYKFLINSYFYVAYLLFIYYAVPLARIAASKL